MYLLKTSLFSSADFIGLPIAILLVLMISKVYLKNQDALTQKYFKQGLLLRILMIVLFTAIMQYYYKGGDSYRYYVSIMDMRSALSDGAISYFDLLGMKRSTPSDLLFPYFEMDELGENHYYMMTAPNFTVPKIGALMSYAFFGSYLGIALIFSFYSLLGALEIYKIFARAFPNVRNHIAFACFFVPTVAFWSSGILKDSLTFGATGFLFASLYNIFQRRGSLFGAILAIILAIYLLYTIKPYILLALVPAMVVLLFIQFGTKVRTPAVRGLLIFFLLVIGGVTGFLLYQNLTTDTALERYNTEVILQSIEQQRDVYDSEAMQRRSGSSFSLGSDSPALFLPLGLIAAYFRPFPWEASSAIMILNVLESLLCLILFVFTIWKTGFLGFIRIAFSNPLIFFCLIFACLFGAAVGTSTGNFGSLVRYKIPGIPFFLILFFTVLATKDIRLPKILQKLKILKQK